ncbi:hypothetical protein LKL95_27565 [Bacillus cereus]|uniref:hypothetical protein n=1 Tax=Bacillus cereus group TaxID=86661 RepID=UPI0002795DE5|nr:MULTISPECIES: hypothetical protein [Bacillus cereus group]EJQ77731.1 hypothetical protein IGO_05709 [Bacillus toyonensis]MCC2397537.1 hypothetical protein [Bacillus cereus]
MKELYTKEMVVKMLEQYKDLELIGAENGDLLQIKMDLDRCFSANIFKGEYKVVIACLYVLGLNMMHTSRLLEMSIKEIKEIHDDALETIEAILNGYKYRRLTIFKSMATDLETYIDEVWMGITNPFDIRNEVYEDLRVFLAEKGDVLSKVALGEVVEDTNKATGFEEEEKGEEYPFYQTSPAIEDPMRKTNFIDWKISGYDHFQTQDRNRKILHIDDLSVLDYMSKNGNKKKKTTDNKGENN